MRLSGMVMGVGILWFAVVGFVGAGDVPEAVSKAGAEPSKTEPVTGILGAFEEEVEVLAGQMEETSFRTVLGRDFLVGRLGGRKVVLGMSGIGKVNAAVATGLLLEVFKPSEVIFTGIAGGIDPNLLPGDIIIGEKTAQHDLLIYTEEGFRTYQVRNPLTGRHNPVFFAGDEKLLAAAWAAVAAVTLEPIETSEGERRPKVVSGVIVTGDAFIASKAKKTELRDRLGADAAEMEGAAVAQVCAQQGVGCLVIRCLSNTADSDVEMDSMKFYRLAAHNSARFVREVVERLGNSAPGTGDEAVLVFSLELNPAIYQQSAYKKPPQFAIWLENERGDIRTVWVTEKTGRGSWGGETVRPVSLPYWVSRWNRETGREGMPNPKRPVSDAVTGATPRASFQREVKAAAGSEWTYYIEVNVSGDFNERFPKASETGRRDEQGNGQPSLVYRGRITAKPGQTSRASLIGRTEQWEGIDRVIEDTAGITRAKDLLSKIAVFCR